MTTLAPASCAASAAQNAALPAPTTITSATWFGISSLPSILFRRLRDAAMRLRPGGGILHEFFHFLELALVELAALLGDFQHVPPGGERVQRDTEVFQYFFALGKDVIEKEHKDMVDDRAGAAQRLAEIDLAAAVGGHILDQKHAVALLDVALDLRIAAEALWLLTHILH